MREKSMSKYQTILLFLLVLGGNYIISAQSTIFNIPSTDVVDERAMNFELDFISHFDRFKRGGFQSYGYRTNYGFRKKMEVGANIYFTRAGGGSPAEFQPNLKWKAYENEDRKIAVSTGVQFFVPLNRAAGKRTYGMVYANASKVIKRAGGLRLTGGGYKIIGAARDFGTRHGAIVGVEQPIKWKFSFIADWYSGKNKLGYAAAGINYAFARKQFLTFGYNWGNSGRGNNAFSAFYGFTY
jgi:hypothetical protein